MEDKVREEQEEVGKRDENIWELEIENEQLKTNLTQAKAEIETERKMKNAMKSNLEIERMKQIENEDRIRAGDAARMELDRLRK